jgi:serine/threonine-protein kinase HipA
MTDALHVWTDQTPIAVIEHEGRDDQWRLRYATPWLANPQAFPLSPALSLASAKSVHDGYGSATIKRFIEHLLPEGRALDVAVAYKGLAKSNVFGLIRVLGAETAGALQFTGDTTATPANAPTQREIPLSELAERVAQRRWPKVGGCGWWKGSAWPPHTSSNPTQATPRHRTWP